MQPQPKATASPSTGPTGRREEEAAQAGDALAERWRRERCILRALPRQHPPEDASAAEPHAEVDSRVVEERERRRGGYQRKRGTIGGAQ